MGGYVNFDSTPANDPSVIPSLNTSTIFRDSNDGILKANVNIAGAMSTIPLEGGRVFITNNDTSLGTLEQKLIQGAGITLQVQNPGSSETLLVTVDTSVIQARSERGQNNGYAPLDSAGIVPAIHLPSFVEDVLEFADLASFPVTGMTQTIYIALDTHKSYRWSGSMYIEISPSDVNSVNGQSGIVNLDADDISDSTTTNKFATQGQLDKS